VRLYFVSSNFYAFKRNDGLVFLILDTESCKPRVARAAASSAPEGARDDEVM